MGSPDAPSIPWRLVWIQETSSEKPGDLLKGGGEVQVWVSFSDATKASCPRGVDISTQVVQVGVHGGLGKPGPPCSRPRGLRLVHSPFKSTRALFLAGPFPGASCHHPLGDCSLLGAEALRVWVLVPGLIYTCFSGLQCLWQTSLPLCASP